MDQVKFDRRDFLKQAAGVVGAAAQPGQWTTASTSHSNGESNEHQPDVIFAEPVGSCTDIVAIVLAPIREEFHHYRPAPFTVLVDPARLVALQKNNDPDVAFYSKSNCRRPILFA